MAQIPTRPLRILALFSIVVSELYAHVFTYFDPYSGASVLGLRRAPPSQQRFDAKLYLSAVFQKADHARAKVPVVTSTYNDGIAKTIEYRAEDVSIFERAGRLLMLPLPLDLPCSAYQDGDFKHSSSTDTLNDICATYCVGDDVFDPSIVCSHGGLTIRAFEDYATFVSSVAKDTEEDGRLLIDYDYWRAIFRFEGEVTLLPGFAFFGRGGVTLTTCDGYAYVSTPTLDSTSVPQDLQDLLTFVRTWGLEELERIGFDTNSQSYIAAEDMEVGAKAGASVPVLGRDAKIAVYLEPYMSISLLMPSGKATDYDKIMQVPSGAGGFMGASFEAAIGLYFPTSVRTSVGLGVRVYEEKEVDGVRLPTQAYHSGLFPWKYRAKIKPGPTFSLSWSVSADNFVPRANAYIDYVYVNHREDSISVDPDQKVLYQLYEDNTDANGEPLTEEAESLTSWTSHSLHVGVEYGVTDHLYLGIFIQTTLGGERSFKTDTLGLSLGMKG